jgi:hypothetical protein
MTATLNYDLRNGLEFGTDEMGQANLKMVIDFALETFFDTLLLAARAEAKGMADTNMISVRTLCHVVWDELMKQDEEAAGMWNEGWFHIVKDGTVLGHFLKNWKNTIYIDAQSADESESVADLLLYLDLEALTMQAKMWSAQQA